MGGSELSRANNCICEVSISLPFHYCVLRNRDTIIVKKNPTVKARVVSLGEEAHRTVGYGSSATLSAQSRQHQHVSMAPPVLLWVRIAGRGRLPLEVDRFHGSGDREFGRFVGSAAGGRHDN